MKKGEKIAEADLMPKRPSAGIPAKFVDIVVSREVKEGLTEDTILTCDIV